MDTGGRRIQFLHFLHEISDKIAKASKTHGFQSPGYYAEADKIAVWCWGEYDRKKIFTMEWPRRGKPSDEVSPFLSSP
jgi:hypothetical protein